MCELLYRPGPGPSSSPVVLPLVHLDMSLVPRGCALFTEGAGSGVDRFPELLSAIWTTQSSWSTHDRAWPAFFPSSRSVML